MAIVKSQSLCGGQYGLTISAKIFFKSLEIYLIIWSNHFGQYFFGKVLNFLWPQWSTVGFQVC